MTLVGLGAKSFDQTVAGMYDVAEFMGRQMADGELKDWQPMQVGGHAAIAVGNRYFAWKNSKYAGEAVEFARAVDPKGVLANMAGDNFVHTIDNDVDYTECTVVDGGRNE